MAKSKSILKIISGALRNTINAHGPITSDLIPSASKRIKGQLKEFLNAEDLQEGDGDGENEGKSSRAK